MPPKRKAPTKKGSDTTKEGSTKKKPKKGALAVGDNVSTVDVTLTKNDGSEATLAELCEEEGIVVFMYPRANTGGCTKQACGFRDNYDEIRMAGFQVYGLSFDKPKSQTNWKEKYSLPFELLTDDDNGTALKAFGAFKPPKNVLRSHVIVQKGGKLVEVRNGISPGDSFTEAVAKVKDLK